MLKFRSSQAILFSIARARDLNRNFGVCFIVAVLVFSIVTSYGFSVVHAFSGDGSGTAADPYIITTVAQLQEMNDELDAWYVLGANSDASATSGWNSGQGFNPIGDFTVPFTGNFDGRGYVIYDLYINRSLEGEVGLFGRIGLGANIQNVGLVDIDITGNGDVGGFVGENRGTITDCQSTGSVSGSTNVGGFVGENFRTGSIINCCFTGTVSGSGDRVGGFVGQNYDGGSISNCHSTGSVSGDDNVGGFIGWNYDDTTIDECYSKGSVSGEDDVVGFAGENRHTINNCYSTGSASGDDRVGGFIGENYETLTSCYSTGSASGDARVGGFVGESYRGSISDCYSTGGVSGGNRVGGFTGYNYDSSIINCYSTGSVSGSTNVGGFVGENLDTITSCYWDTETSGMATSDGGVGKTTAEMKKQSIFTGWDFTSIWFIVEDVTYPALRGMPEETVCGRVRLAPVGGISTPINKLEILTPYLALAGLIGLSTVYIIKKRKD